jgi:hypothetical protein
LVHCNILSVMCHGSAPSQLFRGFYLFRKRSTTILPIVAGFCSKVACSFPCAGVVMLC